MSYSDKDNIPLSRVSLQVICHGIILKTSNAKQFQKSYLEGLIPAPHIMSKSNF
jgi:hypothetical protein